MVTLKSIAEHLNLSIGTVSLALNHSPLVNQETAERVHRAAARFGYVPNRAGRALQSGKSRTIGCLVGTLLASFFSELVEGMGRYASQMNYALTITWIDGHEPNALGQQVLGQGVDGVIFAGDNRRFGSLANFFQKVGVKRKRKV